MLVFRPTRVLLFVAQELKEKLLLERARREERLIPKTQVRTEFGEEIPEIEEVSDDALAKRLGLKETDALDVIEEAAKKQQLQNLINEQRRKYNASKDAFLEWQAGQREKGSANRLRRQAYSAEATKRHYTETVGKRLISVAYHSELGDNSNNDINSVTTERMLSRRDLAKSRGKTIAIIRKR